MRIGTQLKTSSPGLWNDTAPTATRFSVRGVQTNGNGQNHVAYLFGDKPGLIKCGGYQGSGTSGYAIDCGFEPGWVLIKVSSNAGDWRLHDNKRLDPGENNTPKNIRPNRAADESAGGQVEFTSNGFKLLATF